MHNVEGNWVGRISGTNIANVFVEITQVDQQLSGVAHINDPIYGTAIYNIEGVIEGIKLILRMSPDISILKTSMTQTIKVNNRPVNVEVPAVNLGNVVAEAEIQNDFTISGKWTSTIGTGGTLFLRNESIIKKEKEKISQYELENHAFVMMSISPDDTELVDVLNSIKRATKKFDIECKRVDEIHHSGKITDLILEYLNISKYLVCDISRERPNVYYELGYAHGIGKEVILIAKQGSKMHFDIKDYNTIFYRNMTELEEKLIARIDALLKEEAQRSSTSDASISQS